MNARCITVLSSLTRYHYIGTILCRVGFSLLILSPFLQSELKEAIGALEAEKKNLMAELSSTATDLSEAKKKMVASVSTALEDEFECAICNELFINVSILFSYLKK